MQQNSRTILWGGAVVVAVVIVGFLLVPAVYVLLVMAVALLVGLVLTNRLRQTADQHASQEADNDEASARLGTLVADPPDLDYDDRQPTYDEGPTGFDQSAFAPEQSGINYEREQYDATSFDTTDRNDQYTSADQYGGAVEYEELTPETEWTTAEFDSRDDFAGSTTDEYTEVVHDEYAERAPEAPRYDFETTFESEAPADAPFADYTSTFDTPPAAGDSFGGIEYESFTGTGTVDPAPVDEFEEEFFDEHILDDLDTSTVLADVGVIDESKVTTPETILAASQVSRFEPETMTNEESNEETREILGRVAALLAKYE